LWIWAVQIGALQIFAEEALMFDGEVFHIESADCRQPLMAGRLSTYSHSLIRTSVVEIAFSLVNVRAPELSLTCPQEVANRKTGVTPKLGRYPSSAAQVSWPHSSTPVLLATAISA
jgi:hypothetical protein